MSTPGVFPHVVINNIQGTFEKAFRRAPHLNVIEGERRYLASQHS